MEEAKRQAKEEAERKAAAEKLMAERMAAEEKAKKEEEEKKHNEAVDGEESKSELADMKKRCSKCSPGDAYNPTECDAACEARAHRGLLHARILLSDARRRRRVDAALLARVRRRLLALALQGTGAAWRAASAAAPTLWHRAFVEELKGEAPWLGWAHRKFKVEFCERASEWAAEQLDDETKELNRLRAANDGASKEDVKSLLGLGPLHAYRDALLGAEKPVEGSKEATEAGGLHWYHGMTKGKGFYSELTGSPEEGEGGGGGGGSKGAGNAATRCLPRPMATNATRSAEGGTGAGGDVAAPPRRPRR